MGFAKTYDDIPFENDVSVLGPDKQGMMTEVFYAFNTIITLQAFGDEDTCKYAFAKSLSTCRTFERRYSRTLPHSDIARLNTAAGNPVSIHNDTAALLQAALRYCESSEGLFDITVGTLMQLWNFHEGIIPIQSRIDEALAHVDWHLLKVWETLEPLSCSGGEPQRTQAYAQLTNPLTAVDVGGIAKGWIADKLTEIFEAYGVEAFLINLGGNVVARGRKPDNSLWRIGLQDPNSKNSLVGAIFLHDASAVTSGTYQRQFECNGKFYHHILNPKTGYPAQTNAAGATVVAQKSLDAEGYSTTLLALGIEEGLIFANEHPSILEAYLVDKNGVVHTTSA